MTTYEFKRWLTFRLLPTHLVTVRNDIKSLVKSAKSKRSRLSILDVGGRKSPYTVNVSADITLLDVPQEEGTREALNLGFTKDILGSIQNKRSNIQDVVIEDMTKSTLRDESYDAVVCVEVIEHVEEDDIFVKNISKVIASEGWAYFTTPNGDYIKNEGPNKNPDHVRHYTKLELQNLLEKYFEKVDVHYAVKTGKYRVQGLKSYKLSKPYQTFKSIVSNIINRYQSKSVANSPVETAHLIAIAYK
ncbi:methyltransferase domain-containing protein [Psychroserpens sp.]|uniref:methyltransferase domain-containing protein n=1 Tax=Psychroserpens sp. TaxID=2020870 RepID=UPI001B1504FD|nr:methyltransferase domain-containing protein [Psychroserpens sp.]MBO6606966.1 methyltransferase domain-containing protein [Psychroserpens sp.]MBO6654112.1 methyltransferase domain-containing protein [Psychroserpens sp.]MBO6682602.1 methyltransferase domain-containing protein [Psychroserpens sp.]MBO6750738.1 methyltransferase domain-containing protein [Psychroserpens sp.]MBO6915833.1 methyltransferase domain-containing protein [Psychroserpens sp.]